MAAMAVLLPLAPAAAGSLKLQPTAAAARLQLLCDPVMWPHHAALCSMHLRSSLGLHSDIALPADVCRANVICFLRHAMTHGSDDHDTLMFAQLLLCLVDPSERCRLK